MRLQSIGSAAEHGSGSDPELRAELGSVQFLTILGSGGEHLDLAALSAHQEAPITDVGHRADTSPDLRESPRQALARLEDPEFPAVEQSPGRGGRVASANQVVSVIHMGMPVDLRLGIAAPTLVTRLRFVLRDLDRGAARHKIGGFFERLDPHGEQALEIYRAKRV